ncbi:hypothetical protein OG474_26210 [Kribbella sp. NBC_01505]|uniref:hypothetical protein n=1 Tax=Kribbella sp. NBC_01505 TaxID=2903580 RepID=UPI0038689954
MSSYGPPGGQQYPQQQYETLQYGGPPRPPRRGPSPLLIGGIVGGVVVAVVIAALVISSLLRGGSAEPPPAAGPKTVTLGGDSPGQAKALTEALTASKMECSVRFTVNDGGLAGCFLWTDRGHTQSEVRFQYRTDGTVIAVNAQSLKADALRPLIATLAGVVFPADQDPVNQAFGTDRGKFDGSWGTYNTSTGTITRFVAGKSGASPLSPPRLKADTPSSAAATALKAKGFTCDESDEDCKNTFPSYNKHTGDLTIRTTGLGSDGISYLIASVSDTSKDALESANYDAFAALIETAFNVVHGPGTAAVREWITKNTDGESHTAYVSGWRVELVVNYGSPYEPNLPGYIHATMYTDSLWTTPDQ